MLEESYPPARLPLPVGPAAFPAAVFLLFVLANEPPSLAVAVLPGGSGGSHRLDLEDPGASASTRSSRHTPILDRPLILPEGRGRGTRFHPSQMALYLRVCTTIRTERIRPPPSAASAFRLISSCRNRACAPHGPVLTPTVRTPSSRASGDVCAPSPAPTSSGHRDASSATGSPRRNAPSRSRPSTT